MKYNYNGLINTIYLEYINMYIYIDVYTDIFTFLIFYTHIYGAIYNIHNTSKGKTRGVFYANTFKGDMGIYRSKL